MYVVFDIGGTKTRLGVSGDGMSFVENPIIWETPALFEDGMRLFREKVAKWVGPGQVGEVAGGIAGVLDKTGKKLVRSPHLQGWIDKPLCRNLEEIVGVKVNLENDAAMAGLGEATVGAGRRYRIVAYLTISTGIGGHRIVEGKLDQATYCFEPGHQIIDVNGKVGYFEDFASGSGIEKTYGKPAVDLDDPSVWEQETRILAIGIHNVTVFWSPEIVILGGAVAKRISLESLKGILREQMQIFPTIPEIAFAELGDLSGLYGALRYLKGEG